MSWRREDVQRLHEDFGCHLYPTNDKKKPAGKWRHGGVDYVEVQPTDDEIRRWASNDPPGWAVLCGGPNRLVALDVEVDGMRDESEKGETIRRVLDSLPDTCKRTSPKGGMHAWMQVTDSPAPDGKGCKLVTRVEAELNEQGRPKTTLLAEYRGHGQYAIILGHGRGDLPDDFALHSVTLDELNGMLDELRAVSDLVPAKPKKNGEPRPPGAPAPDARDWVEKPPVDTGDVLAKAIVDGDMSWLDVLDDGWEELGSGPGGWSYWLRPSYDGDPVMSATSANGAEGRGHASLTVHSSSVPWAEPGESYSPGDVLARSGRLGSEVDYVTAMRKVEGYARLVVVDGEVLDGWPTSVLEAVVEVKRQRLAEWRRAEAARKAKRMSDWLARCAS